MILSKPFRYPPVVLSRPLFARAKRPTRCVRETTPTTDDRRRRRRSHGKKGERKKHTAKIILSAIVSLTAINDKNKIIIIKYK